METKGKNNNENQWLRKHFGFCLPFPGFVGIEGKEDDQSLNPFPLMTDLRRAFAILPIQFFYLPLNNASFEDNLILASHESFHLSLVDTTFHTTILSLIHFQYVALWEGLRSQFISVPSLNESSGFLVKVQNALDLVDIPMAFIHELMAITLAEVFLENGLILLRPEVERLFYPKDYGLPLLANPDRKSPETASDKVSFEEAQAALVELMTEYNIPPFNRVDDEFVNDVMDLSFYAVKIKNVKESDILKNFRNLVKKIWLPYYHKEFNSLGYNFTRQYKRLRKVWRIITNSLEGQEGHNLVLKLSKYPFNLPFYIAGIFEPYQAAFEDHISYVNEMAEEPIKRLEELLIAVENAPKLRTGEEWYSYLTEELSGFSRYEQPVSSIRAFCQMKINAIWEMRGYSGIAKAFSNTLGDFHFFKHCIYSFPIHKNPLDWFTMQSTMFDPLTHLTVLESMRQLLIALRQLILNGENLDIEGPRCFCAPEVRDFCVIKHLLLRFWGTVTSDVEYKSQFEKHWKKPVCASD